MNGARGIPITQRDGLMGEMCDLEYADDLALFSTTVEELQRSVSRLCDEAARLGLRVNASKTELMANNACPDKQLPITINGHQVSRVDKFKYLGATITTSGDLGAELPIRIGMASGAFNNMTKIWKASAFSVETKCKLFDACVLPILLYGCESWHLTRAQAQKVSAFEMRCLRRILDIKWYHRITNDTVRRRTQREPITSTIMRRRWTWLGHVLRMPSDSWPRRALFFLPSGSRRRGRPSHTVFRSFEAELRDLDMVWEEVIEAAQDRARWRSLVASLCP
jgi:hypothetical protein